MVLRASDHDEVAEDGGAGDQDTVFFFRLPVIHDASQGGIKVFTHRKMLHFTYRFFRDYTHL